MSQSQTPSDPFVVLTVRGTPIPSSLEAARVLHNETAGSAPGIAAARALGDLSHNVYAGKGGELLFIDTWVEPAGIMKFFSDKGVQEQGARLFREKEAAVWMRARGSYSYHLPAPAGKETRHVGLIRGPVASPEQAIAIFTEVDRKAQRDARRRGLLSHEIFIKVGPPGEPLELLGLDRWADQAGMAEHYADASHMSGLQGAFSGAPAASVWDRAGGAWSEW